MERKVVYGIVAVGVLGAGYLAWRFNNPPQPDIVDSNENTNRSSDSQTVLATPTLITPTITPTPENRSKTTVVNGSAVYEVTSDPGELGRQCVKLSKYIEGNRQDVTGAAVALGLNPAIYIDIAGGDVYSPDGTKIGSFDRNFLPDNESLGIVAIGTIICANPIP